VTFDIDANGIMHVSAKDKASGKEQSIRIEASSGLSDAEKEAMINDAEKHADEDAKARDLIDIRNKADAMVYQTEKNLKEYGEKVPGEMKAMLEEKVEALKSAQTSNDKDVIEKALNALTEIWNQASGSMYEAAKDEDVKGASDSGAADNSKSASEEQVEEADFEVVDDADPKK
jgi:molecular chaperone DnaK